jgi:hypothetical protein
MVGTAVLEAVRALGELLSVGKQIEEIRQVPTNLEAKRIDLEHKKLELDETRRRGGRSEALDGDILEVERLRYEAEARSLERQIEQSRQGIEEILNERLRGRLEFLVSSYQLIQQLPENMRDVFFQQVLEGARQLNRLPFELSITAQRAEVSQDRPSSPA